MTGSIPMYGSMQDLHGGNDDASRAMIAGDDVDKTFFNHLTRSHFGPKVMIIDLPTVSSPTLREPVVMKA